jgi:hypothetical protein
LKPADVDQLGPIRTRQAWKEAASDMISASFDSTIADEINEGLKRLFGKRAARATVVTFNPPLGRGIDTSGDLAFETENFRRCPNGASFVSLEVFFPFFFRIWEESMLCDLPETLVISTQ